MSEKIQWLYRDTQFPGRAPEALPQWLGPEAVRAVSDFHGRLPGYAPTPLVSLEHTARELGFGALYVKDESQRLNLNAFKVLGASYAIGRYLAREAGLSLDTLSWQDLKGLAQSGSKPLTLVTATDGNHGRAVAWVAQQLGCRAVVYMPKGSAAHRLEAILETGAHAEITDMNYDDAVRLAAAMADDNGWVLIQDTAWEGYMEIPEWIMAGYATLAEEIDRQLGGQPPTHLILQAGVGSFAAGVLGAAASRWRQQKPVPVIAEPDGAACIFASARAADGVRRIVGGDLNTIMAGLACGEPNLTAWPILRDYAEGWASCADAVAAEGMRRLARPEPGDTPVVSGESGAVGMGILCELARKPQGEPWQRLGLGPESRVLLISTEGDTDPVNYRRIVDATEEPF